MSLRRACGVAYGQEGVKPVASIIHYKQYRDWRRSGVAFEFGDQTYTNPNRTMASYAEVSRTATHKQLSEAFHISIPAL